MKITVEQCKTYLEECKVFGSAPDISTRRATAVMAVCPALVTLSRELAEYTRCSETLRSNS